MSWTKEEEKEAYPPAGTSPQEFAHRYNYFVSLYLQEKTCSCWLRRLLFAAQQDDLCGQFHVIYPGRYNYSCGSVPAGLYL